MHIIENQGICDPHMLFEHVKTSRRKEGVESVFSSTEGTYNS